MIGDLFDSPWKILIIALVIIVLFGSKKLPHAARSLGQSMRILKKEVHGLHEDEPESRPPDAQAADQADQASAELTAGNPGGQPASQAQIDALQQQIRDLQHTAAIDAASAAPAATAAEASRPARQPA
jgi:sec-independent protein translocase protein TatA